MKREREKMEEADTKVQEVEDETKNGRVNKAVRGQPRKPNDKNHGFLGGI
ncbi:MAG: hypothetical protein WAW52_12590 [Methanothrix sp.]